MVAQAVLVEDALYIRDQSSSQVVVPADSAEDPLAVVLAVLEAVLSAVVVPVEDGSIDISGC